MFLRMFKNAEMDIVRVRAKAEGKPDSIIENMVKGKLNKYLKEVSLFGSTVC